MEQQIVREVLSVVSTTSTKADKVVGARFNEVAMLALNQAEQYIMFGPESSRMAITKQMLSSVARLSAADTEDRLTAHRQAFMREIKGLTQVEAHLPDVDAQAITARTDDQDIET